jgi:tetratricopeptide (TPR) repeat protein
LLALVGVAGLGGGRLAWAEYHLRAGRQALDRHAPAEAREHLAKYLRVWPRGGTGLLLGARAARALGDFAEAERLLAECERLGADRDALALEEHLLDAQRGNLEPAGEEYLRARLRRNPAEAPRILEAMTLGYLYTYRLGEALRCLEVWLGDHPDDAQALCLRGWVREGMQDRDGAGEDYRRAVAADPAHAEARRHLAEYLLSTLKTREAAGHFEHLLAEAPDDPRLLLGLARCRARLGQADEARRLFDRLLARDPRDALALRERALLERDQEQFAEAGRWFRAAVAADPHDRDACYGLAQVLEKQGQADEARRYRDRAREIDRDAGELRDLLSRVAGAPGDAELRYRAALLCLRNGQREEGRRWLLGALRLDPRHAGARAALAGLEGG